MLNFKKHVNNYNLPFSFFLILVCVCEGICTWDGIFSLSIFGAFTEAFFPLPLGFLTEVSSETFICDSSRLEDSLFKSFLISLLVVDGLKIVVFFLARFCFVSTFISFFPSLT